jgi:NADH dehydrogenase
MAPTILIAGGGFGGFYAARTLERELPPQAARIVLVNDVNFLLFSPLLPGAAAGTLDPRHVVVPLRRELKRTDIRLGRVTAASPQRNCLTLESVEGHEEEIAYDHLIVALGSVSRTLPIPGLAEHAIGFKTLSEAIALRNRVVSSLEMAESLEDPAERAAYLTFVFVGAGYAGLEGIAELQDFAADLIELYPRCRTQGMRWILVEKGPRLMPEIPPELAEFAADELRHRGLEIRTGESINAVTESTVTIGTESGQEETVPCRMVAWTAGVKAHPVVGSLGVPLDRSGRIIADRTLRVEGHANVWALGDAAAVPDPAHLERACPPTAQHAQRQGKVAARNVVAALRGRPPQEFNFKTLGVFVDMGRYQAVASTLGIKWRGFPAWFLARTYHLSAMPGTMRKLRLVVDWTVDLLFARDASELGQLGHPPALDAQSAGGTPVAEGEKLKAVK